MSDYDVILNRCVGDEFDNEVTCDYCKAKGTVVVLFKQRICKWCLEKACVAINRAVLNREENPKAEYKPRTSPILV